MQQESTKRVKQVGYDDDDAAVGIRGQWPCHVYISVQDELKDWDFKSSLPLTSVLVAEPHISLSKPFTLARHEIDRLVQSLSGIARAFQSFKISFATEPIFLTSESMVTFCALKVSSGRDLLEYLLMFIDHALEQFGKEPYYEDKILHASIATWLQGQPQELVRPWEDPPSVRVTKIYLKTGHIHHELLFSDISS